VVSDPGLRQNVSVLQQTLAPDIEPAAKDMSDHNDLRTLELTTRERDLLLRYGGYLPERRLLSASPAVQGVLQVRIGAAWIDNMVDDLIAASLKIRRRSLLEEIDELCWVLEEALENQSSAMPALSASDDAPLMELPRAAAGRD
jgi:hypothetical protein